MSPKNLWADRELEAGSVAHYEDPAYYTQAYKRRVDDVRYYEGLAAACGGAVLEYGCGNGRITLPMARRCERVVGVDLSKPMLDDLRKRLAREPEEVRGRVTIRRGDMRRVRLRERFPLVVCPFNAFLHLYGRSDIEAFLARVREHLTPRGEFVLDVSIPEPLELSRVPTRAYRIPSFHYPTEDGRRGERVKYTERFDYDKLRQILFISIEFEPESGDDAWMTPIAHRQFHPEELEAFLHYNGFRIDERFGDFKRTPVSRDSETLVLHCRPRRGFRP